MQENEQIRQVLAFKNLLESWIVCNFVRRYSQGMLGAEIREINIQVIMDLQLREIWFLLFSFFFQDRNYGFYLIWINLCSLKWSRFLTFSPRIKRCKKGKIVTWMRYQQVQLDLMKIYLDRYIFAEIFSSVISPAPRLFHQPALFPVSV